MLLVAALSGFCPYELLSRLWFDAVIPFMMLTCIASLWVLAMLLLRFTYRV